MIITAIDQNFEQNFIYDFLPSLFKYYDGVLAVIDYGLTDSALKEIEKYNLHIKKCDPIKHIVNIRMRDIYKFLESPLFKDSSHVMMVDSGDVWFQDSFSQIFTLCEDCIGFVEAGEVGTYTWMESYIRKISLTERADFYSDVMSKIVRKKVAGAGMVCGPKNEMIALLKKVCEFIDSVNQDCFCLDMIALNYVVQSLCIPYASLPVTYDFNVIRFSHRYDYRNGVLFYNRAKMKIVHNSGGYKKLIKDRVKFVKRANKTLV